MFKRSKEVTFGIFAIIAIVLIVYGLNFMAGSQLFGSPLILYAKYANVEGLNTGNPILINGLRVGRVAELDLDFSAGIVTAKLEFSKKLDIPKESQAMIISTDLLGAKGIKIWVPDSLPPSTEFYQTQDFIQGTVEAGIFAEASDLVTTKGAQILLEIGRLTVQLNEIVALTKAQLNDKSNQNTIKATLENIRTSSDNLTSITYEVDSIAQEIAKIANGAVAIVQNVEGNNDNIDQIIENVKMTTDSLVTASQEVKFLMTDAARAVGRVESMVSKLDSTGGTLGLLLNDTQLYDSLAATTNEINALLREVKANPQRFVDDVKLYIFESKKKEEK
ncbi:MAG: MlaD family protein [Bacteroidia bacterium]|nr:MlaD family protein [Bacteroidia bacterium]